MLNAQLEMGRFRGQVVVVTSASSGVGRAVARAFGREGARVGLIGRGPEGLAAVAQEIRAAGGEAQELSLDVADARSVAAAADWVVLNWGRIDVWVNNAIGSVSAPGEPITPEEYRRTNHVGAVHGTLAALHHMRPQHAGAIVQIGSAFGASKDTIRGFTDAICSKLAHQHSAVRLAMVPVPPYQPEVIARAVLRLAAPPSRQRDMWTRVRRRGASLSWFIGGALGLLAIRRLRAARAV